MIIGAVKRPYDLGYKLKIIGEGAYPYIIHNMIKDKIVKEFNKMFDSIDWRIMQQNSTYRGSFYHIEISFNNPADEAYFILLANTGIEI
jgi:hypothetical protein